MNKSSKLKGMCMASVAVLLTTSCSKDAAYDDLFEDDAIDLTVGVAGGGLTLPFGSTEKIYLTKLIDPEDSEVIETDGTGKYFIRKDGTIEKTEFTVDPVHFSSNPTIAPVSVVLDANKLPEDVTELLDMAEPFVDINGKKLSEINDLVKSIPAISQYAIADQINIQAKADNVSFDKETTFNLDAKNVDTQLVSLTRITPSDDIVLRLDLKVKDLPGKSARYLIHLSDVVLSLPSYVKLFTRDGLEITDPTNVLSDIYTTKFAGSTEASAELMYIIRGFDFANDPLVNNGGHLLSENSIKITGKADIEEFKIDLDELTAQKVGEDWQVQVTKAVNFAPVVDPIDVTIQSICGKFNPTIDPLTTSVDINLGDDVDFLKDKDVVIDVENPELRVDINYNAHVKLFADIDLTVPDMLNKVVSYKGIEIDNADNDGKQTIILTRIYESPTGDDISYYANEYLSTLLSPIPDKIDVKMTAKADQDNNYDFTLGEKIAVSGSYDVNIPFVFNSISFVYDEESEDIFGDDDDITKYLKNLDGVTIEAEVESTLPLDVTLDLVSRDKNGNEKSVLSEKPVIKSGNNTLSLHPNIVLSETKDLIYRFSASGKGEFNANQFLQLKSSKLTIRNQKVDLNDL